MRVTKVRIDSFGAVRERSYEHSPGMTVFFGPNESGKTTTMEFIRSCFVPSNRRKVYPERSAKDSGSMEYEDDGVKKTVTLSGRSCSGDLPSMPNGTGDQDLYRSVFAMDSKGLDDEGAVDELKSRFLTVPGGERMPAAIKSCQDSWDGLLGKKSNSKSQVNFLDSSLESVDTEIFSLKAEVDRYGELSRRRDELKSQIDEMESRFRSAIENKRIYDLYQSQKSNFERLAVCRRELDSLGDFRRVTEEDEAKLSLLEGELKRIEGACTALEEQKQQYSRELRGVDPRVVQRESVSMKGLEDRLSRYRADRAIRDESSGTETVTPDPIRREVQHTNPVTYAGIVLAVAGIIGFLFSTYALAITVLGTVLAVFGLMRPRIEVVYEEQSPIFKVKEIDRSLVERMRDFESEVSSLVDMFGLTHHGIESDAETLIQIRNAAGSYANINVKLMSATLDKKTKEGEISNFREQFGGPGGYDDCKRKTADESQLKSTIAQLESVIEAAGLDPSQSECPVGSPVDVGSSERDAAFTEIGSIDQKLKIILDTEELERLMDKKAGLKAELDEALISGAVAYLAESIAKDACEDIYSTVQPGVVSTADRFLNLMTGGAYMLDVNPMTEKLSVRSADGSKEIGQWSSGLRAQVLLSVKLAIARELGEGKVPVILDDVLLPFDSKRKAGAVKALSEVSSEMQVIMFTCDAETAELCSALEGVSVIDM